MITHAHEDHIGAVAWLWPQLRCPVYATPFAAAVLRRKLGEAGLVNEVRIHVIPPGGTLRPGAVLAAIHPRGALDPRSAGAGDRARRHGTVLHTGDWKLDPTRWSAPPTDEAAFAALGEEGVLAMVCDSHQRHGRGHIPAPKPDVRRQPVAR